MSQQTITIITCDICKAEAKNGTPFHGGFEDEIEWGELKGGKITACVTFPTIDDICPNCVYRAVEAFIKAKTERLAGGTKELGE